MQAIPGAVAIAALLIPLGGVPAAPAGPALSFPPHRCVGRLPGDINHDGHADAVIGQPLRSLGSTNGVGAVNMLPGAATGLTTTGNQYVGEETVATVDGVGPDDLFGMTTVTGFFNFDCYADVAIGVPHDDSGAGGVVVIYGGPSGLDLSTAVKFTASTFHVVNGADFGGSLAAGDFNGDQWSDLAIGAPATGGDTGGFGVLYDSPAGLTSQNANWFNQGRSDVPGTPGQNHVFGWALAAADFTGDGVADLAIGAPGDDVGATVSAGTVTVLHGSATGLSYTGGQLFSQDTAGVPDAAEQYDQWGSALAAGDVTGDGKADLVVGAVGESVGAVTYAGAITVLMGDPAGLTATGSQEFDQDTAGVPGVAEQFDMFGQAVSVGDYNGDGHADVAVGAPGESIGTVNAAGSVTVFNGTATGLTVTGVQGFNQGTAGIQGAPEDSDQFGASLWSLYTAGTGTESLIIGVPGEDSGGFTDNGAIAVLLGSAGGLTATGNQFIDATVLAGGAQASAFFGATEID